MPKPRRTAGVPSNALLISNLETRVQSGYRSESAADPGRTVTECDPLVTHGVCGSRGVASGAGDRAYP